METDILCPRCNELVEEFYQFFCPTHGMFHPGADGSFCELKSRTRCDGESQPCCPICGFMPCWNCCGRGKIIRKTCYTCKGTGVFPYKLRTHKTPEEWPSERFIRSNFQDDTLNEVIRIAVRAGIRYFLISPNHISRPFHFKKEDDVLEIRFINVRDGHRTDRPLDKKHRRRLYGWLMRFSQGKHRRFKANWEILLR